MIVRPMSTVRRGGALLLALALLPGWVLPPECGACPHMGGAEAHAPSHRHQHVAHEASEHGVVEPRRAAAPDRHAGHRTPGHDSTEPHEPHEPSESHDGCGCPCDVQCAAPGLPASEEHEASEAEDAEAHVVRIDATRLRIAAAPYPPFFIPFSNAPPR